MPASQTTHTHTHTEIDTQIICWYFRSQKLLSRFIGDANSAVSVGVSVNVSRAGSFFFGSPHGSMCLHFILWLFGSTALAYVSLAHRQPTKQAAQTQTQLVRDSDTESDSKLDSRPALQCT